MYFSKIRTNALLIIVIYDSGLSSISFLFKGIQITNETFYSLNELNKGQTWFRCYVTKNKDLELSHLTINSWNEENLILCIESLLLLIQKNDTLSLIANVLD